MADQSFDFFFVKSVAIHNASFFPFLFERTHEESNNVAYNFMRHKNFWTVSRILPQLFGSLRGLESSSLEINKLSIHDEENQTCAVDFGCGICKSMREIFAVVEHSMC